MTQPKPSELQLVRKEVHKGDAVVRPFLALVYEFTDRVKQDFDDHGDCLFCEITPVRFAKAGVIQIIGTDIDRPAAVHVFGICEDCAKLYADGLARALGITWEGWCRGKLPPPSGVF